MDTFADILNFVFDAGRIQTMPNGYPDPDSVEVEIRFEANERGVDANAAVEFALQHIARPHKSGTAPDTSLWLGLERRTWLKERGGIQPTLQAMIDRAMKRNP